MPKVKKKRVGFVIDMTPLVDITFLLLTFFMFTAKFKSDAENEQKFIIKRPQASPDTTKLPEVDLATIKVAFTDSTMVDTSYYFTMTNEEHFAKIKNNTEGLTNEQKESALIKVDLFTLEKIVREVYRVDYATGALNTRFAIDADQLLPFDWVNNAMEVLRKNNYTTFNYVTDKRQ